MQIGLIGGIGPAATDFYYRRLIETFAAKKAPLDLTIVHADTPTLVENLGSNQQAVQAAIFGRLTKRLASAGADAVAITSIAGHFCIEVFKAESPLPVINMIAEVSCAVRERGLKRIGILGTRTVMESRFYGAIQSAEIVVPMGQQLDLVHEAYVAMASFGVATDAQRSFFHDAARSLLEEQGAEAVMLGGTDLALVFDERRCEFPLVDCAAIHVEAIARWALPSGV